MAKKQTGKPRMGRPPKAYALGIQLSVRLGSDRVAALQRWADREGKSVAGLHRDILEAAIQGEGLRVKRIPEEG